MVKRNYAQRRRRNGTPASRAVTNMPPVQTSAFSRRTIRFVGALGSNTIVVSRASLLDLVVTPGGTTNTYAPLYDSVRIRGLKIFIPGNNSTNAASPSVTFSWLGYNVPAQSTVHSNVGSQGYRSDYLRPPRNSRASLWSCAGQNGFDGYAMNEQLLSFSGTLNEGDNTYDIYVDLDIDCRTSPAQPGISSTPTISAASSGTTVAYAALDNHAIGAVTGSSVAVGTWKLVPQGFPVVSTSAPATWTRSGG